VVGKSPFKKQKNGVAAVDEAVTVVETGAAAEIDADC
jgi:hypothetical protein